MNVNARTHASARARFVPSGGKVTRTAWPPAVDDSDRRALLTRMAASRGEKTWTKRLTIRMRKDDSKNLKTKSGTEDLGVAKWTHAGPSTSMQDMPNEKSEANEGQMKEHRSPDRGCGVDFEPSESCGSCLDSVTEGRNRKVKTTRRKLEQFAQGLARKRAVVRERRQTNIFMFLRRPEVFGRLVPVSWRPAAGDQGQEARTAISRVTGMFPFHRAGCSSVGDSTAIRCDQRKQPRAEARAIIETTATAQANRRNHSFCCRC